MRFFYFFLPKAVLQRGPFFSSLVKLKSLCSMPNHIQRPSIVILYQKMANTLYSKKKKKPTAHGGLDEKNLTYLTAIKSG